MSPTTSTRTPRSSKLGAKLARKPRTVDATKPEAETIPLARLSITITKPKIFSGDEETVTFDGERLAEALRYVALSCPNLERFTDANYSAIELAGIAQTCKGLSDANPGEIDSLAIFHALYRRLDDLAARMNARDDYNKLETVTITRKPAAGPSSSAEPDAAGKIAAYDAAQKIVDAVKRKAKVA